ncbi:glycosyltransferase, partial [bacterium]|nr:glycosyltransferase [bacterium]
MHNESMKKKTILFFHLHMKPGGVERQLYYLVNGLAKHHHVTLLLCEKKGEFLEFIDHDIYVEGLGVPYKHRLQLKLFFGLISRVLKEKPDFLVSFHGKLHWISVLAARLTGINVTCVFPGYMRKGLLWIAHNLILRMSDGLVAVSQSVKNSMMENFKLKSDEITVIENAIDINRVMEMSEESMTEKEGGYFKGRSVVISIGRLVHGKGFNVIIDALSKMGNDCLLLIVGDGPERKNLEIQINSLQLSEKVVLLGMQQNPYKFLKKACFFVLASESEGLPTVILEAMSLGIPCICAKYLGGTEGII